MSNIERIERLIRLCEFNDFSNVQDFFKVLNNYDYRVVGGFAVAYYIEKRAPTKGDIDVLINAEDYNHIAEDLFKEGWKVLKRGLKHDFEYADATRNKDEFDLLLDEFEIIDKSPYKKVIVQTVAIKLMTPEWIIPLKLMADRDKDLRDIVFLLQSGICDNQEVERAVIEVLGENWLEDLESLQYMATSASNFGKKSWFEDK